MLLFLQQFKHIDFSIVMLLTSFSSGISNLFVYCYFGKVATESFENMAISMYETDWHELPIELQKSFIIMIQIAQKPLFYSSFGLATLNLKTFLKVRFLNQWIELTERNSFRMEFNFAVYSGSVQLLHDIQDLDIRMKGGKRRRSGERVANQIEINNNNNC